MRECASASSASVCSAASGEVCARRGSAASSRRAARISATTRRAPAHTCNDAASQTVGPRTVRPAGRRRATHVRLDDGHGARQQPRRGAGRGQARPLQRGAARLQQARERVGEHGRLGRRLAHAARAADGRLRLRTPDVTAPPRPASGRASRTIPGWRGASPAGPRPPRRGRSAGTA